MGQDRQYGFRGVAASWTVPGFPGIDLKNGIAPGTSLVPARTGPAYTMREDGQGNVLYVEMPGDSGTLTLDAVQEGKLDRLLRVRYALDRQLKNQVGTIIVTDDSDGGTDVYLNCRIIAPPMRQRGVEATTHQWVFGYGSHQHVPGTADQNLVGGTGA